MRNVQISNAEYISKLENVTKEVYKILPLYERYTKGSVPKNQLMKYIDKTISFTIAIKSIIGDLPHSIWYVDTIASLLIIEHLLEIEYISHPEIRKYILDITNLISTEIKYIKEG